MASSSGHNVVYDQEVRLNNIFDGLSEGFKNLDKVSDAKKQSVLKEMTAMMQGAKTLIRDFEREAKANGMPASELNYRKKQLVQELNGFIGLKKAYSQQEAQRAELLSGPTKDGPTIQELEEMSSANLMEMGRKQIGETDKAIARSARLVNDTIGIGAQTAETLQSQGKQLEKVADDLDEIHFTMKKARQVVRDMARGLATDRCIMLLLAFVVVGIVVIIILKIAGVDGVL